jgi:hypothetical protein
MPLTFCQNIYGPRKARVKPSPKKEVIKIPDDVIDLWKGVERVVDKIQTSEAM